MESPEPINIYVAFDPAPVIIPCPVNFTAEELCIRLCQQYDIPPLTRTLFALRIKGSDYYLKDNSKCLTSSLEYEFRIRFKVPKQEQLKKLDEKTFEYYFQQTRNDAYSVTISEITYPKHKDDLMGLVVADMYRAFLEDKICVNDIMKNHKKYIPHVIIKRHGPFSKKMAHQSLLKLTNRDYHYSPSYVKNQYIQQVNNLAPNYLSEKYENIMWQNGDELVPVHLHVAPFYPQEPGIRLYHINDAKWSVICTIKELVYLTRNQDNCLEISRSGTPLFFKFHSEEQLTSFISICDGYYRLMIKWTFNLSKDDETPSLLDLQRMKCHGPVGGAFSYRKLEEKRGKKHGCYIIRQCQEEYNVYYMDVCNKHNTTETYKLEFRGNCYFFNNEEFGSYNELVLAHQKPDGKIYLKECLPPSEYDKSHLLLCGEPQKVGIRIDQTELQEILKDNSPRCLSPKDILMYTSPWCYIENTEEDYVYSKQYCDIPFCDDRDCELFLKESSIYSHMISLNQTSPNIKFSVRLWNPDYDNDGVVKLLLSIIDLPASSDDFERWGTGIELTISNNVTGLTIGNNEFFGIQTPGILKSTEYTNFTLSWTHNMLILGIVDVVKPIYITEIDSISEVHQPLTFKYYSMSGVNSMWEFPFCDDEYICEQHTTFYPWPAMSWPLRRIHMNYDLHLSLRSYHSAIVYLTADPYSSYPRVIINIDFPGDITEVVFELSENKKLLVLGKKQEVDVIDYWEWTKLHITIFGQELQVMIDDEGHLDTIVKVKHDMLSAVRWFSIGANYSISHWAFYCDPEEVAAAYPPECALTTEDYGYSGTQWVTSSGLPCIPWIDNSSILLEFRKDSLFVEGRIRSLNYCRNINMQKTGPWCFVRAPEQEMLQPCDVRRCSAMDCKVAGTANDYAGEMSFTRSNRTCAKWSEIGHVWSKLKNSSLYPEGSVEKANNFCRNPSRSLAGAWCFTKVDKLEKDLCDVKDCSKDDNNIVFTKHGGALRYIYVLPQWKHAGKNGGLYFSLKTWNPDLTDGILFKMYSADKLKSIDMHIGAEKNEKVILSFKDHSTKYDTLLLEKALPHLIPIGKWGNFWIQMLKGGIRLGYQKRENPFVEWMTDEEPYVFEPSFMTYQSLEGNVIGVHFPENQCHTENTSTLLHTRIFSLHIWKDDAGTDYTNLTIYLRGTGVAIIPLLDFPGSAKTDSCGIVSTYKAHWKLDHRRKLNVAYKALEGDKVREHLKDFVELASRWACVQSGSLVRLYGITLHSPTAMVLEYLPYGPFDDYLRNEEKSITALHLKKVATSLARALWDLSEAGIIHGYIRCRRLLVAQASSDRIIVKLSGPSLRSYTPQDIHWMPVEFFSDMSLAKRSVAGDIWAFATTLWEVFSFGKNPTNTNPIRTLKSYQMGDRLLRPEKCPTEIWSLITQSWHVDPHHRPRPQEIMRDLNHLLHTEYMPRHDYEEPKLPVATMDHEETVSILGEAGSNNPLICGKNSYPLVTDTYDNGTFVNDMPSFETLNDLSGCPSSLHSYTPSESYSRPNSPEEMSLFHAPRVMESIVKEGKTYLVTLTKVKLGSGNYGRVYKGWIERDNLNETTKKEIAVKIMSHKEKNGSIYENFKNELDIMKSLQHSNIVEILGFSVDEGCDVRIYMEYMEEGSLNNYLNYQGFKLQISHLLKFCLDIASGMDHVSAKNIVHRDLATRNILVVNKHHVKITDFGLARIMPKEENEYKIKTAKELPINWCAPEAAVGPFHFSTKSDVWAYGVTVWEIFSRAQVLVPPFNLEKPYDRASCFTIPKDCPAEVFRDLMKNCWELEPSKRPSFIQLVHKCKGIIVDYQ